MQCPDCGGELEREAGQDHYEANGDIYSYYWCDRCEDMYEECRDYRDEKGTLERCHRR